MDEVMPMLVPSDLCLCQVLYLVSVYKCKIYSLQCEFKSSGCCDDEDTRQRYLSRFGYLDVNIKLEIFTKTDEKRKLYFMAVVASCFGVVLIFCLHPPCMGSMTIYPPH